MIVLGFGVLWFGYAVGSYGYVLVKGWNITFKEWVNPLHPYKWPNGDPPKVPIGKVWPTPAAGATQAAMTAADLQNSVIPGSA